MNADIITRNFFCLLRAGAFGEEEQVEPMSAWKWKRAYQYAVLHGVSALIHDGIRRCASQFFMQLPEALDETWKETTRKTEAENKQTNERLAELFNTFNHQQLRPILLKGAGYGQLYDQPLHRAVDSIDIFFPYSTQAQKADKWVNENANDVSITDKKTLKYTWKGACVEHHQRVLRLTNTLHNRTLQGIIEQELRETQACYIAINNTQIEVLPHTLSLLLILLRISHYVLNEGVSLKQVTDLGMFLRKAGDKVDYVKLQDWIERMRLQKMANLSGVMLQKLLNFSHDEIPFMSAEADEDISRIMKELFLLRKSHENDWYFRQGNDIFVHSSNSSAMFWQVRHSARYFKYYPSESITNMMSSFTHSLSHIEE